MLRAFVLDHKDRWEEHLPLVEFAYDNSYQASIQMAPYEALYGRPCRSPICCTKVGECHNLNSTGVIFVTILPPDFFFSQLESKLHLE